MKILVSIATKRNIHAELVKWLLSINDLEVGVDIVCCPEPLEHARNLQVKRFMEGKYDCLFIVDSDCVPPSDSIRLIRSFNIPILSIPHPTMIGRETGLMVMWSNGNGGYTQKDKLPLKDFQECDAVGCSGLAIQREVFERMNKPYFKFLYEDGLLVKGEDFYFCDKAKKLGYGIYALCKSPQSHYVEMPL